MDDIKEFKPSERSLTATSIEEEPVELPPNFWRRWWLENSIGYRYGVFLSFAFSATVLLINIILLLVSVFLRSSRIGDTSSSQRILYEGSCEKAKKGNVALHFGINVLSTVILVSSSYCMQCLAAPTREEVDIAHSQERWLDIGVPGFRNLKYIGKKRAILWALLGVSSLPLHLL
jgi:hypothetical protein